MTRDRAEVIALNALAFLAESPEKLQPFLNETGLMPAHLSERAGDSDLHVSLLDWLLNNESLLLVFATGNAIAPDDVMRARHLLVNDGVSL
ncbi:MAG: DUF3572 domain-containing protein [Pseudomonadota bacterium]